MLHLKYSSKNSYLISILFISILYSYTMGSGLYGGYLGDYYGSYSWPDFNPKPLYKDYLGWEIVSLKIYDFRLGVYITSFILSYSVGKLLYCFFKINKSSSLLFFLTLYLIIIHTWPVFNSTSNAMRTGLAMSSMFLSLCALHKNKNFKSFFFIIMTTFLHFKTGPILILTYLVTIFIKLIFNNQFFKKYKILFVIICLLNSFLIFFLVSLTDNWLEYSHRIIGYDFSIPFFFINIFLIFFFTYKLNYILKNYLFIFIYFYLFIPLSLFFHGLPTQYERLHMMMLILYILSLGVLFKKRQTEFFWLISFSLLMLMTYLTGMYSVLR